MVLNLFFASNIILSSLFLFFLIIHLNLITAVIAQIFIPTADFVIPAGIATIEAKAEVETDPVTIEAKISNSSL